MQTPPLYISPLTDPFTSNQGLCHCLDCRKLSGSPYTYNFIAHRSEIKVTGTPSKVIKTADSENTVVNYFCSDCGEISSWKLVDVFTGALLIHNRHAIIRGWFVER
jgi:hypothetical protein